MGFTYKGLSATLSRHIITDSEVEHQLQRLLQQNPRITPVADRPTQLGDEVVLDYAGFCDGVQFAGGTAENQSLVLGSGAFIPGFEEQLLDKVPGQDVTVKVTFPTEYHAPELAGKEAEFRCKIHQIRVTEAHKLDDTFAKEVGGFDTLDQLRQALQADMQAHSDRRGEMDLQDRLLDMAAATLEFTPSDSQVEAQLDEIMQNLSAQLAHSGLTVAQYCQFMSTTEEKLREDSRADAVQALRRQAAIETVVDLEGLEASKEELGQAVAMVARQNNMTVEELKPYYDAAFEAALRRSILTGKAMELIRANATITEE